MIIYVHICNYMYITCTYIILYVCIYIYIYKEQRKREIDREIILTFTNMDLRYTLSYTNMIKHVVRSRNSLGCTQVASELQVSKWHHLTWRICWLIHQFHGQFTKQWSFMGAIHASLTIGFVDVTTRLLEVWFLMHIHRW